jgi:hypothetical protein
METKILGPAKEIPRITAGVWDGHSCPPPLTLMLTLTLISICHPEEAESYAKRATPDEDPALSLPKGPMHFPQPS